MYGRADKRQSQSIAEDWLNADLVCLGSLSKSEDGTGKLLVGEVLKGDEQTIGKTFPIMLRQKLPGIFPSDANERKTLVFFSRENASSCEDVEEETRCNSTSENELEEKRSDYIATEIYSDSDKIAATRCLAPVFAMPSEAQRLKTIGDYLRSPSNRTQSPFRQDSKAIFRREFLAAIAKMREAENFSIVSKLYDQTDPETKHALLDWMACTGDSRSLQYLIAAVSSPDRSLRSTALTRLTYYYPGAAGVDECIETAYDHGFADTKNAARDYVAKRRGGRLQQPISRSATGETPYQRGEELLRQGQVKEATAAYVEAITEQTDGYVRRWSALKAIPHATLEQMEIMRKALLPLLTEDATTGNYLEATDAAEILQKLTHEDCLPNLITLLNRKEPLFAKANRMSAFGLASLEQTARKAAAEQLLEQITKPSFAQEQTNSQLTTILALAWIGDSSDCEKADTILRNNKSWKELKPILTNAEKTGDTKFLLSVLKNNPQLPHLAKDWIIVQLGLLRETEAVELIFDHMRDMKYQYDGYVADEALKSIGGEEVCNKLEELALSDDELSRNAVDILCDIKKENSLPVLRKIVQSQSPARTNALAALGRMGTPDDLALLQPLSDFWSSDRLYHYWTMEAIASIRERHGYNVNGPISSHAESVS